MPFIKNATGALLLLTTVLAAGCAGSPGVLDEAEAVYVEGEVAATSEPEASIGDEGADGAEANGEEGEVPLSVAHAESEGLLELPEVIVTPRYPHEAIRNRVLEARLLLEEEKLQYTFTGKGKKETLRGRPVAFALWSEQKSSWIIAHVEIPRPPIKWKPGGRPLKFISLTPGIQAHHVKGTGAERLMFAFSRDGEELKVYGRKFPVFDAGLLKKKRWRDVAATAKPIVYLPFTTDTLDPLFISGGKDYLLSTARKALDELRQANAPSLAYPGELLADIVPPEVITTLAVIEQTDDSDFVKKGAEAFNEVLSQYGLKTDEAYRYSVSRAAAIGPMQFTDRRGNGTYSMVVRRCPLARIDPDFERGATNLLNAMKAAICLFDIELAQMRPEIRNAYRENKKVLGIFPVAAYNGGPRNVTKLYRSVTRMNLSLHELRGQGELPEGSRVACPCLWREAGSEVLPVAIPRYNNENRWYIEKYQNILGEFDETPSS
jgi:hypothetical protein